MAYGALLSFVFLGFWVWAVYDVITTPDGSARNLPKVAWVFVVLLFFVLGAFAWVALGRPYADAPATRGVPRPPRPPRPRSRRAPSDARDEAHRLSERERLELERREYYRKMDEELDRRLEEKRGNEPDEGVPES